MFFFFNIFGFLIFIVFIAVVGIVLFIVSGAQRAKQSFKRNKNPNDGRASTSTGSSYQRYASQNTNYRSQKRGASNAGANSEVIEIPILEVTDVTDSSK